MRRTRKDKTYWPDDSQDKKVPTLRPRTQTYEESTSATPPPSAPRSSHSLTRTQPESPSGQHSTDPGTQLSDHQGPNKRNKRNYEQTNWTTEEKQTIFYCFAYSRHEMWGRRKKYVFEDRIKAADLPPEKKETTTTAKLLSIASQAHKYLSEEVMEVVKANALEEAEKDYQTSTKDKKLDYGQSQWKVEEKWTLLWATEYAKNRHAGQRQRCQEWQQIFFHHCPNKVGVARSKLTTQKYNTITQKYFTEEEMDKMKADVAKMVSNNVCPLTEPLEMPKRPEAIAAQPEQVAPPRTKPPRKNRTNAKPGEEEKEQSKPAAIKGTQPSGGNNSRSSLPGRRAGKQDRRNNSNEHGRSPQASQTERK